MLTSEGIDFVTERHLATLSTHGRNGTIHTVPVGFTYADGIARITTNAGSQKAVNIGRSPHATISQVEGPRWLTLIGRATISDAPDVVADAVQRYAQRYRMPGENPQRVVILVEVERVLGTAAFRA